MNTGMSSDAVKKKLAELDARATTHNRAVTLAAARYPDNPLVTDYKKKWDGFLGELASIRENTDSWTGIVYEQEADNAVTSFGILLTEFSTLATKLTVQKGKQKLEILEELVKDSNAPGAKNDHKVVLPTDALPAPRALVPTPALTVDSIPQLETYKRVGLGVFGVGGILGFLLLLKKLFGG